MTDEQDSQPENSSLIPSDFVLDLNRSLAVPHNMELPAPWNLPSRMFQFPITASEAAADGSRRFGLMHPLLADHPFVRLVEAELGVTLDPQGAPNEFGFSENRNARWWHAVDLISSGHWRELLETRQFTTSEDIAGAVTYGLDYSSHTGDGGRGYISTAEARAIMIAIDTAEPADRPSILASLAPPSSCTPEGGKVHWPVNSKSGYGPEWRAWARIFGIESGWLKHDAAGFLQWTVLGRDAFAAGDDMTFTEQKTGQGAFAF